MTVDCEMTPSVKRPVHVTSSAFVLKIKVVGRLLRVNDNPLLDSDRIVD